MRKLPTAALPFLSVLRHVQVSSGRLTFVVALPCDRPFTMSRFPRVLSRLAFPPARLVPSRRHPWGFSLQRFDLVLSPVHLSVRRALRFLGWPHRRRSSRTSGFEPRGLRRFGRFAGFHAGCVWRFAGPSSCVSVRFLFRGSAFCKVPSSRAFRFQETASRAVGHSRVAPVDFANMLQSRSFLA